MMTLLMTPLDIIPRDYMQPHRLWWLLLVPAIGILYLWMNDSKRLRRPKSRTRLDLVLPKDRPWKRHVAVVLALLSLASLVLAYAQPEDYTLVPRDRATIVIAVDVSQSMVATDVSPNRIQAAEKGAVQFLNLLPQRFNVALVSFAGTATLIVPPTTDRGAVTRAIDNLQLRPSTAIGEGVFASLDAIKLVPPDPKHPNEPAPAAIVLLSDGATNMGRSSSSAAQEAKKEGVPVYTIAYGTATGYVIQDGQKVYVPVDHQELATVAKISGGKTFSAASASELKSVYSSIAQSVGFNKEFTEVTGRYAGFALLFAILAALGVISLGARWP